MAKASVLVGTASWTDRSLVDSGRFYPQDVKTPEDRLRFYSEQFPFVEVDSTYYSLPTVRNAALWTERTPEGFVFDVKAFRLFTGHQTPPDALPKDVRDALGRLPERKRNWYYKDLSEEQREPLWQRFENALGPLLLNHKLGAVIFQLPPWLGPNEQTRQHLQHCADRLDPSTIAVEFRNRYWLDDEHRRVTLAFLRENGLAYVVVDEPQGFPSSVPRVWEVTNPEVAVVRLHGRNASTWEAKGLASSSERFNYLYSDTELEEFVDPLRKLAAEARSIHVAFNNNYQDYSQRNARRLMEMLL
jgi:uncharacterized protein YecE (DUF72 family)